MIEDFLRENEPLDSLSEQLFRDATMDMGMMHILPEGLLFGENELKDSKQSTVVLFDQHNKKKNELAEFFYQNFDRRLFQTEMRWVKKLSQLEENLNNIVLKDLFGIEFPEDSPQEVRKLALLIPGGQYLKGNVEMLALVSQNILGKEVNVTVSMNKVLFTIMVDGLNAQQYQEWLTALSPYFNKVAEWFLPYDCICTYEIKAHERHLRLDKKLILNYNTRLWKRG